MRSVFALSVLPFIVATSVVACSSTSSESGDEGSAAVTQGRCTSAAYDVARDHYRAAVSAAKARLETTRHSADICAVDNPCDLMLFSIAERAHAAVKSCGDFREVIATKDEAEPLREAMKDNNWGTAGLALASFDGRLTVLDDGGRLVMKGIAPVLSAGVTLWGPVRGAYGNMRKIRFGADNEAVLSRFDIEAEPALWRGAYVSYAIGDTNAKGVKITITDSAGKQAHYRLAPGGSDAPFDFRMTPEDESNSEVFTAFPGECSGTEYGGGRCAR